MTERLFAQRSPSGHHGGSDLAKPMRCELCLQTCAARWAGAPRATGLQLWILSKAPRTVRGVADSLSEAVELLTICSKEITEK